MSGSSAQLLYTEACTVVRTDAGLSESFEMKVGLHQGSVLLSQLLFAVVTDVVSSEARSGLPYELYADDLLDKGLKVNAGKPKMMVGINGGKMIVNSGKWLL